MNYVKNFIFDASTSSKSEMNPTTSNEVLTPRAPTSSDSDEVSSNLNAEDYNDVVDMSSGRYNLYPPSSFRKENEDVIEYPLLDNPFETVDDVTTMASPIIKTFLSGFDFDNFGITAIISQASTLLYTIWLFLRKTLTLKQYLPLFIMQSISFVTVILYSSKRMWNPNTIDHFRDMISSAIRDPVKQSDDIREHLKILENFPDRISVRKYVDKHNLHAKIRLPSCSWDEVVTSHDATFHWIFKTYSSKFLSMWFGIPAYKIEVYISNKRINNIDLSQQFLSVAEFKFLHDSLSRLIGVFMSYLMSLIYGTKFSKKDVMDGVNLGRDFSNMTGNLVDDLFNHSSSHEKVIIDTVNDYSLELNKFLEIPTFEFARSQQHLHHIKTVLNDVNDFIRKTPREFTSVLFPLQGLVAAASKRKNEILTSILPQFKRQEPFVVLFQGKGAIGKTRYAQFLAQKCINELLLDGTIANDYIEIRHDDKYWPPLSGQRVAFFDEVGTVNDVKDDLLLSGIKGICSPAYFNCPSADIEHKISPCPFQLIFAATNKKIYDLQGKIASAFSQESVYPTWRRCIVIECEWNEQFGKFNFTNPSGHREDFAHLNLHLMQWDEQTQKLVRSNQLTTESLFDIIRKRFRKMESDHVKDINTYRMQRQSRTNLHYSVHLHGPPGAGKSPAAVEYAKFLHTSYHLPIVNFESFEDIQKYKPETRAIYILDDLFTQNTSIENQELFMEFYNVKAVDNSIFIFCSNLTFSFSLPVQKFKSLLLPRKHVFSTLGLTKRLGLTGEFSNSGAMPEYNTEMHFDNDKAYTFKDIEISIRDILYAFLLACVTLYFPYILPIFIYYLWNKLHYRYILVQHPLKLIFNGYKDFLKIRNSVPIIARTAPLVEYEYILRCKNISDVNFSTDRYTLYSHCYKTMEKYNASTHSWKCYISERLIKLLGTRYNKFLIDCKQFSISDVESEMSRLSKFLHSYNIEANCKVIIDEVGEFSLVKGVIYKDLKSLPKVSSEYHIYHNEVGIVFGHKKIPFVAVTSGEDLVNKYNLSFDESIALYNYIESSRFKCSPVVIEHYNRVLLENSKITLKKIKDEFAKRYDAIMKFGDGFVAKVLLKLLFMILTSLTLWRWIYKSLPRRPKKHPARERSSSSKALDISDDEALISTFIKEKGKSGRKKPRVQYDSDEEPMKQRGKGKRKPKVNYDSDNEGGKSRHVQPNITVKDFVHQSRVKMARQDINTLADMNSYDSYKPYLEDANVKCRKNLCMMYFKNSLKQVLDTEPRGTQACYGLFIKGKTLVTVGHLAKEAVNMPHYSVYVGCDQFNGKFYRAELVRCYSMRDISVWTVDCNIDFKDISNLFLTRKELANDTFLNIAFQRFGTDKKEVWLQGPLEICHSYCSLDEDGIEEFGFADFGTYDLMLTTGGDCGLPYYVVELKRYHNKILGIHCMGNITGYMSVGIPAIIYRDDINDWFNSRQNIALGQCEFCLNHDLPYINVSIKPKSEIHEICWGSSHTSSPSLFYEEIKKYLDLRKDFSGLVIKNSGALLGGSHEHSHTQFLTGVFEDLKCTKGWEMTTAGEAGFNPNHIDPNTDLMVKVYDTQFPTIFKCLDSLRYARNFRLHINVYNKGNKRRVTIGIWIGSNLEDPYHIVNTKFEKQGLLTLPLTESQEVYVCPDVLNIMNTYRNRLERGLLPNIPFENLENNSTVQIIGTTHRDMSPLPTGKYYRTPYSLTLEDKTSPHKYPVRFDIENAPLEIKNDIAKDRLGRPDQLVHSSLKWAHRKVAPNILLRQFCRSEYRCKILKHYSGLSLLTDNQVLHGYPKNHRLSDGLQGLELDSSIGWTLKQLFCVTKKNDVLSLSEKGEYTWLNNDCADYAKWFYEQSKHHASLGHKYWSTFNELLKLEKLKPEKVFYPRSFTAEDLNGVLMERYIMGEFCARAMLWDINVGVGTNAYIDFHKHKLYLDKHPNIFTGDYKNFDRTIPVCAFDDIRDLLIEANSPIANEIYSCFETLSRRIQISGTAVMYVEGGMPSGSFLTAPLNSILNDYMVYTAYVSLCWKNDRSDVATYFMFDKLVSRLYYGDDVILSVSNEIKDFFHLVNLANELKICFGMEMTSSSKSGELVYFENYTDASWISRFFRRLDKFNYYVGALKKISINSHFHYLVSLSDEHIGSVLTVCQEEAALWEQEYYDTIQQCCRMVLERRPNVQNYFSFRSRLDIQDDLFRTAIRGGLKTHFKNEPLELTSVKADAESESWFDIVENDSEYSELKSPPVLTEEIKPKISRHKRNILRFRKFLDKQPDDQALSGIFKNSNIQASFNRMSVFSKVNELFQKGCIAKPLVSFDRYLDDWKCEISTHILNNKKELFATGTGPSKASAREEASDKILDLYLDLSEPIVLNRQSNFKKFSLIKYERQSPHFNPNHPILHRDNFADDKAYYSYLSIELERQSRQPQPPTHGGNSSFGGAHFSGYGGSTTSAYGHGVTKSESQRNAMQQYINNCKQGKGHNEGSILQGMRFSRQMNVSRGVEHRPVGTQMVQMDPSVAPDSGIATNVQTVSPVRVINPTARALDNPAGTGAAFDKRDYCYGIYTRWTEKQGTINGSLKQGAEVFRISLDPMTLPLKIKEYVMFHDSIIPQIDVQILIGGAAGSIGWLKLGWVPDASREYTLDDLQMVAAEELNMNTTLTMQCILNDNRKSGLFRYVQKDPEPWPALILMIDHPALNVQRNDDVDYPVFVNVRLGPDCVLMQPYRNLTDGSGFPDPGPDPDPDPDPDPNPGDPSTEIDVDKYLELGKYDLLLGSNSYTVQDKSVSTFPDCGFNTANFIPKFTIDNMFFFATPREAKLIGSTATDPSGIGNKEYSQDFAYPNNSGFFPILIGFAYGEVYNRSWDTPGSKYYLYHGSLFVDYPSEKVTELKCSTYSIPEIIIEANNIKYTCSYISVYPRGCTMQFAAQFSTYHCLVSSTKLRLGPLTTGKEKFELMVFRTTEESPNIPKDVFPAFGPKIGGGGKFPFVLFTTDGDQASSKASGKYEMLLEQDAAKWDYVTQIPPEFSYSGEEISTFVLTGNDCPSDNLPSQIKSCYLVRPGTTSEIDGDAPFTPIMAPGYSNLLAQLETTRAALRANYLSFDVEVGGKIIGKLAYSKGFILARSQQTKMIKSSINKVVLKNIVKIDNVNTISAIPLDGFSSWVSKKEIFKKLNYKRQMWAQLGASALGGLFTGLSNTLQFQNYQEWANQRQRAYNENMKQLADINGANQRALSKQNFQQRLELMGISSHSNQFGNNSPSNYQPTQTFDNSPAAFVASKQPDVDNSPSNSYGSTPSQSSYNSSHIYEEIGNPTDYEKGYVQLDKNHLRQPIGGDIYKTGKTDPNILDKDSRSFANLLDVNDDGSPHEQDSENVYQRTDPFILGDSRPENLSGMRENFRMEVANSQMQHAIGKHPPGWGNVVGELSTKQQQLSAPSNRSGVAPIDNSMVGTTRL